MTAPLLIKVGGLHTIDRDLPSFRPTHLIGILDPAMPEPSAYTMHSGERDALVMRFHDSEAGVPNGPTPAHVQDILALVERALDLSSSRLFVHCHAGASRSTATAFAALVRRNGAAAAEDSFAELLRITNKPWPNRRIVEYADGLLGAGGRMLAVLDGYRDRHPNRLRAYIRLHHRRARHDAGYGQRLGMASWRSSGGHSGSGEPA